MEAKVIVDDTLEWLETFGVPRETSGAKRYLVADLIEEEYKELLESLDSAPYSRLNLGNQCYAPAFSSDPTATVDALVDLIWVAANYLHYENRKFDTDPVEVRSLAVSKFEAVNRLRHYRTLVHRSVCDLIKVAHHVGMTYYPELFPSWAARVRKANFAKLWTEQQVTAWEMTEGNPQYTFTESKKGPLYNREAWVASRADGKIMKPPGWQPPEADCYA